MHQRKSRLKENWGVRYNNGEMFGPAKAFTKKYLKKIDLKRRSWQICGAILTICILVFVFSVSPKHLDIRLPRNEDLLETPMLRGQEGGGFDYEDNHYLKRRVVDFLLESCSQLKSYDMLFCHNVLVNGQPLQEPCFVSARTKPFTQILRFRRQKTLERLFAAKRMQTDREKKETIYRRAEWPTLSKNCKGRWRRG